jgi:hypothetical protein
MLLKSAIGAMAGVIITASSIAFFFVPISLADKGFISFLLALASLAFLSSNSNPDSAVSVETSLVDSVAPVILVLPCLYSTHFKYVGNVSCKCYFFTIYYRLVVSHNTFKLSTNKTHSIFSCYISFTNIVTHCI